MSAQPALPFQGRSPQARHASWTGAQTAQPRAGSQCGRILNALGNGALTRHELARETGLPVTTICARLAVLLQQGRIQEAGLTRGPFGAQNITYRRRL